MDTRIIKKAKRQQTDLPPTPSYWNQPVHSFTRADPRLPSHAHSESQKNPNPEAGQPVRPQPRSAVTPSPLPDWSWWLKTAGALPKSWKLGSLRPPTLRAATPELCSLLKPHPNCPRLPGLLLTILARTRASLIRSRRGVWVWTL